MTGKPQNPTRKHEKCPDCGTEMGAAFVRIKEGNKRKWNNKDIKVCTNSCCSTILTHIPRNIYWRKTKINVAKKLGLCANEKAKMLGVLSR